MILSKNTHQKSDVIWSKLKSQIDSELGKWWKCENGVGFVVSSVVDEYWGVVIWVLNVCCDVDDWKVLVCMLWLQLWEKY